MALVFYTDQRYVRKGNDAQNPAVLGFFNIERTQLNAANAQLLKKLRPITFAETFLNKQKPFYKPYF